MEQLNKLSGLLEPDYNANYWSDDILHTAIESIQEFKESDWKSLDEIWSEKPASWQIRLSETLGEAPPPQAFLLLRKMLRSENEKVAAKAATSIRELVLAGYAGKLDLEEVGILKAIASRSKIYGMTLADLIKKFDSPS